MANNVINTRIQLKVDTLTNWQTNNPVLLDGEIAIAKIDIVDPANKHLQPAMIKVGDGTSTFNQLDWVSAKAADVYEWAKASTKPEYNFEELKNIPAFITPDELENYYTKDEINTKLSSVYKYKGTVDIYPQLPTDPEVGDVYNIKYASGNNFSEKAEIFSEFYEVNDAALIPPFSEYGLQGMCIPVFGSQDSHHNLQHGDTVTIGVYSIGGGQHFTSATLPVVNSIPSPAIDCVELVSDNQINIYFLTTSEKYEEFNSILLGNQANVGININHKVQVVAYEPYIVNAGDNVAWTGEEWDVLAGTFDTSNFATKDELSEKANTEDLAAIATSGNIYDITNAGAVQTSVGADDAGEKYIVFNCGSSTTVI